MRRTKAWAIVTKRDLIVGGGTKGYGYTELCVYSTRQGAKEHLSETRNDIVVRCEILILNPPKA